MPLDEREAGLDLGRECWSGYEDDCIYELDDVGNGKGVDSMLGGDGALSFSRRKDRNEELFLGVGLEEVDKTECMGKKVMVV